MIFGFIPFCIGGALFVQPTGRGGQPRTIPVLEHMAPAEVWAGLWMFLGVLAMLCALGTWRSIRFGYVLAYVLPTFWGAANLASWALGELPAGWVACIVYLGYSLLVIVISGWEEPVVSSGLTLPLEPEELEENE